MRESKNGRARVSKCGSIKVIAAVKSSVITDNQCYLIQFRRGAKIPRRLHIYNLPLKLIMQILYRVSPSSLKENQNRKEAREKSHCLLENAGVYAARCRIDKRKEGKTLLTYRLGKNKFPDAYIRIRIYIYLTAIRYNLLLQFRGDMTYLIARSRRPR